MQHIFPFSCWSSSSPSSEENKTPNSVSEEECGLTLVQHSTELAVLVISTPHNSSWNLGHFLQAPQLCLSSWSVYPSLILRATRFPRGYHPAVTVHMAELGFEPCA